jgi:hypothetical protein
MDVKKTMIYKQEHLDTVNGIARMLQIQIKDSLNMTLEKGFSQYDPEFIEKAKEIGEKIRNNKTKPYFK